VGRLEGDTCLIWYDIRMENRIASLVVDAIDAERLARFWVAVLGWQIIKRGEYGVTIGGEGGALEIDFRTVPDWPKARKNRLHLDIKPVCRGQVDELDRLLALGARRANVGQRPDVSWYVLADPEGNEFARVDLIPCSTDFRHGGAGSG
jgi:catechol-2,3-dioxygenase